MSEPFHKHGDDVPPDPIQPSDAAVPPDPIQPSDAAHPPNPIKPNGHSWFRMYRKWVIVALLAVALPVGYVMFSGSSPDLEPEVGPGNFQPLPPPAPVCGNNILDAGEQCDGSNLTQCLSTQACSTSCTCIFEVSADDCGNNFLNQGEACDGSLLGQCLSNQICTDFCTCETVITVNEPEVPETCGDGVLDAGEQCDGSELSQCAAGDVCTESCQCIGGLTLETCGDGVFDPAHEQCEFNDLTFCAEDQICQSCTCVYPIITPLEVPTPPEAVLPGAGGALCGNGIIEAGEACDGGGCSLPLTCNASCTCSPIIITLPTPIPPPR